MHPIRTLEDLIHAVTNSLSLISSHSQYLLGKREVGAAGTEELGIISDEAERAARLLSLVPRGLASAPIHDTTGIDAGAGARIAGASAQAATVPAKLAPKGALGTTGRKGQR